MLIALVGVSGRHEVSVAAFPAQPGEDGAGILRRSVEIASLDGAEPSSGGGATRDVLTFLGGQDEPYRPADAAVRGGADGPVLELGYPAPGPLGLLSVGE